MSLTKEEMLKLAKKCGAKRYKSGTVEYNIVEPITVFIDANLDAYTSAIEAPLQAENEKLRGEMAMLRGKLTDAIPFIGYGAHVPALVDQCEKALTDTQATAEAFRAEVEAKMQLPPVLAEVMGERQRQDGKWGGATTDDQWNALDWHEMISDYNGWARRMAAMGSPDKARRRYIQVAALAVAAVEALDRAAEKRKQAEQLTNKEKEA